MTLTEIKTCRSVWGSLHITYPLFLSCDIHEAIGGTVYNITKLEKDDMIDKEIHQKCPPEKV